MIENKTFSEKNVFPLFVIADSKKAVLTVPDSPTGKNLTDNQKTFPQNPKMRRKLYPFGKNFWKVFAGLVDCRIDNSLKKVQHGQNVTCSMAKNYEEIHFSEKLYFSSEDSPALLTKDAKILTTIG